VAQAQEKPVGEPEYLEFFGLRRPPFEQLPEKSQIFDSEQYSLLMSHLDAATESTDCFVLVRGADGTGKTTLLNRFLNNLDKNFIFATIDDSCSTDTGFYSTILKQLGFKDITGSMTELRLITQAYLVQRTSAGDTVLLVIDNAHRLTAKVLQQLQWLSEQRFRGRRVLSIVMAGNSDIARIIDSPALQELKFRSHVDFHIRVFREEETAKYVHFRLAESGNAEAVEFADNALALVHRFTGGSRGSVNGKGRRRSDRIQEERIRERDLAPRKLRMDPVDARDMEIAQLRESLAEAREALEKREQELADRDARIAALTVRNKVLD
jgi:type II secretory pathway predicted ATPase ExeA